MRGGRGGGGGGRVGEGEGKWEGEGEGEGVGRRGRGRGSRGGRDDGKHIGKVRSKQLCTCIYCTMVQLP